MKNEIKITGYNKLYMAGGGLSGLTSQTLRPLSCGSGFLFEIPPDHIQVTVRQYLTQHTSMRDIFVVILVLISFHLFGQEEKENHIIQRLEGSWGMIDYLDSTLIDKSLIKHSSNPSSYAFMINIDKSNKEACEFTGYHESDFIPILEIEENKLKIGFDLNQYAIITHINDSLLSFKEYTNPNWENIKADQKTYYFRKFKTKALNLQEYFSKIIVGNYEDSNNNFVSFGTDLKVNGIQNFTDYQLLIDFWETQIGGFDGIQFYDYSAKEYKWMKWEYVDEKLILTELEKFVDEDSGMYYYKPKDKKIILTRKKN